MYPIRKSVDTVFKYMSYYLETTLFTYFSLENKYSSLIAGEKKVFGKYFKD